MNNYNDCKDLASWQNGFAQSLLEDLIPDIKQSFATQSDNESQQRFAIYQNNVFHSLTNALGDLYPVVKQLVGDEFFTGMAAYYLREEPPRQAAMVHFGKSFPLFLSGFKHTQSMPYLAPVAQLELARHHAYHAKDSIPLSVNDFTKVNPEQIAEATLTPHPSLQIIKANYSIFTIWQIHQADTNSDEKVEINEPQQVLIVRPSYEVIVLSVDPYTYRFIGLLAKGNSIATAIHDINTELESTSEKNMFDPSSAINFLIEQQLFTDIRFSD